MRLWIGALALLCVGCAGVPYDPGVVSVPVLRETAAVNATGDAADDPAIWVADDPAQSLVIATQKQGGMYVFDLSGAIAQEAPGGRPNNVDLRSDFAWSDGAGVIVGASDRTDNTIVLWRFDETARRLDPEPRARIETGFGEVYGFCLGRMKGELVATVTSKIGQVKTWRVVPNAQGGVDAELIQRFDLGSISEGCVIDDDAGVLYVAQELRGIWRVDLGDALGTERAYVDRVRREGPLGADVEGLTLWRGEDGRGYLIASVQGRNYYAVYRREGDNAYVGSFRIVAGGGADAVSGTDGIDVVSAALPGAPRGLFVAQDDENTDPAELQNFKYVSFDEVLRALGE